MHPEIQRLVISLCRWLHIKSIKIDHWTISCTHYTLYRQLVLIISEVIVSGAQNKIAIHPFIFRLTQFPSANLLVRIYALYGRDKRILTLVLSVSAVLVGFACVGGRLCTIVRSFY